MNSFNDDGRFDNLLEVGLDMYRLSLFDQDIWLTLKEEEIPLRDMTNLHLKHALAFCKEGNRVYNLAEEWVPKLEKEIKRREGDGC